MKKLIWVVLMFLVLIVGCGKKDDKVLIRVAGEKITVDDFRQRLENISPYLTPYLQTEEGMKTLIDGLVKERVLAQEARRQRLNTTKEFRERLRTFEDQLLVEEMVKKLKDKDIAITDHEAQNYFQKHRNEFVISDKTRVSHILVKTEKEARDILSRIKEGADFAELAKKYSIDKTSAHKGGDLDYFNKGTFIPEFEEAAFKLQRKGQISDVVKTPFGWHIIKMIDKKTKDQILFSDVEEEVKKRLEKEKFDIWMERQKKRFKVKVNYDLSKQFPFKAPIIESGEGEEK